MTIIPIILSGGAGTRLWRGDSIKITNNGKKKTEIFQIEQPVLPFEEF